MSWYDSAEEKQQDPWSSIVDLMSAFALVLFLAVTFFIINYNRASEKLKQRRAQLQIQATKLQSSIIALQRKSASLKQSRQSEARLNALAIRLAKKNSDIQKQLIFLGQKEQKLLAERQKLIGERQNLINDQQKLRDEKTQLQNLITTKAKLLQDQKDETKKQNAVLARVAAQQRRCQNQLKTLMTQRQNVLTAIYKSFQSTGTRGIGFDKRTGKFRLGGNVLFSEGKAILTAQGKSQLNQVLKALDRVIWQPNIHPLLSGIMVEGHTSQTGRATFNWKLSARRSLAAVQYILSQVPKGTPKHKKYAKLLFAAAFGQYRPVMRGSQADQRRSRRIEIKVLFKNQERIKGILRQLKSSPR